MARRTQVPDSRGGRTARPRPASPPPRSSRTTARSPRGRFLIAGVGASAGGLEALQKFCNVLPQGSRIAFVLIQHMDPPFSRMDLVSCRNVLLYLLPAVQKKIVPRFHYALRPEGYQFLGTSESIGVFPELFKLADPKNKIYVRKNALVRPYRTVDDKIDGAVLSFSDIDRLKRSLDASEALSRYLQETLDTVREPLLVLDGALRVTAANRSFYRTFATSAAETAGLRVYDLGNGQWNIPGLRTLLEEVLPENRRFEGFEVEHDFPSIGRKRMVLNARRIEPQGGHEERILLAIEDVTDRNPP